MNAFIHKCDFTAIGHLLPPSKRLENESFLVMDSNWIVTSGKLERNGSVPGTQVFNHLAVSDSKILKTIIFSDHVHDGEFETKCAVGYFVCPNQVGNVKNVYSVADS